MPERLADHGLEVRTYAPVPRTFAASPGNAICTDPPAGIGFVTRNGTDTTDVAPAVLGVAVTAPPASEPPVIAAWMGVTADAVARMVDPFAAKVLIAPVP
jgi:hypothetical protein